MLETDDHTMATIMESVLLDVCGGLFLVTRRDYLNAEDDCHNTHVLTSAGDCR
jgi:hypothetical protein